MKEDMATIKNVISELVTPLSSPHSLKGYSIWYRKKEKGYFLLDQE